MNDLMPFEYAGKPIRVMRREDGEPWFVAVDVCRVLGLDNARQAITYLDDDEKTQVVDSDTVTSNDRAGINNLLNVINEPGLYSLILRSRKPEAKAFKRWVTHEVLPSIRKTGGYTTGSATDVQNPFALETERLRVANQYRKQVAMAQKTYLQMYRAMGLRGPQLQLAVQNALQSNDGVDLARITPFPGTSDGRYAAIVQDRLVTPTQLAEQLNLQFNTGRPNGNAVNQLLEQAGLMERDEKGDPCPTEQGKLLGDWVETGKKYHSGAPVTTWHWKECATLEQLRQHQQGAA